MNWIVFVAVLASLSLCQALPEESDGIAHTRVPRTLLLKKKLCFVLGLCGGGGGHHGGGGHYSGGHGYQNHQGGYPPINIGISQSQSSANTGGGGLGAGYYPNNYQYNGGPGYGGYGRPGYFGNGYGANNNQFNGNYYGGSRYPNGYGYRGSFSNYYDEGEDIKPIYEDTNENGPNYDGYNRDDDNEGYRRNR